MYGLEIHFFGFKPNLFLVCEKPVNTVHLFAMFFFCIRTLKVHIYVYRV